MADGKITKARKRIKSIGTGISDSGYTLAAGNIQLRKRPDIFSEQLADNTPRLCIGAPLIIQTDITYPFFVPLELEVLLSDPDDEMSNWNNFCEVLTKAQQDFEL